MKNPIRERKFKLHFNRNNMKRGKEEVWTIHLSDRCIPAKKVVVYVDVQTRFKKDGRQPRAFLEGTGVVIDAMNGDFAIMSYHQAWALARVSQEEGKEVKFA